MMLVTRTFIWLLTLSALVACGRAGSLEPPPSSVSTTAENADQVDADEAPDQDRPFILDGILN